GRRALGDARAADVAAAGPPLRARPEAGRAGRGALVRSLARAGRAAAAREHDAGAQPRLPREHAGARGRARARRGLDHPLIESRRRRSSAAASKASAIAEGAPPAVPQPWAETLPGPP